MKLKASFPPIQSAILLDGQGDGARLQIDIPRSEVKKIPELYQFMGKVFEIEFKQLRNQKVRK